MAEYKNPIPTLDDNIIEDNKYIGSNYSDTGNDYDVKDSVYFAFIDVLGFKKTFDDNQENNNKFADKFKDVFTYYFKLMEHAIFMDTKTKPACYAGQTSDSLYFYTERPDFLIEFLKIFSYFSVYAMTKDVFFRGGIAKGNLFYKEKHQFYGQSVIRAYLLESEISKNPIILIDENTYQDLSKELECEKLIFPYENTGRHFLKPFAYLQYQFPLNLNEYFDTLHNIDHNVINEKIIKNKLKFEYDSKNYGKYSFLLKEFDAYKSKNCNKLGGENNAE